MRSIQKISKIIANKVSDDIYIDDENKEVIAYGAFVLMQTILSILMVSLFGIIFNVLLEALVISFTASILRKFSGGAHANSLINCTTISVTVFGGLALVVKYFLNNLNLIILLTSIILIFISSFYIMYKYSPVDTATKLIRNLNTRKRLKTKSLKFIFSLFMIDIILLYTYTKTHVFIYHTLTVCIVLGIAWQTITLVSLGHRIIYSIDNVLDGTKKLIRRIRQ